MFAVGPFVAQLKRWIGNNSKRNGPRSARNNNKNSNPRINSINADNSNLPRNNPKNTYANDNDTFGQTSSGGWGPEEMFATNAKLFGVHSTVPEENTILTPGEQATYEMHLARLGLNAPATQRSPNKNNRNNNSSSKAKRTTPSSAPQRQQPQQPNRANPCHNSAKKQPEINNGPAFLSFKFDTASIMGSFAAISV